MSYMIDLNHLLMHTYVDGSWTIIQVSVYLPKSYPTSAPLCYVGMRSPDPSVTVPESAHVDCYGRIRGIAYLDPSPKVCNCVHYA